MHNLNIKIPEWGVDMTSQFKGIQQARSFLFSYLLGVAVSYSPFKNIEKDVYMSDILDEVCVTSDSPELWHEINLHRIPTKIQVLMWHTIGEAK